jgi:glycosyltransferase involved in cell wall biosynthesis
VRVLFWGTFDPDVPRNRILREGLARNGCEVEVLNRPVWSGLSRSAAGPRWLAALRLVSGYTVAWPVLLWRFLRAPRPDAVVLGYLGLFDAIVLWPFARLRRTPFVWDAFISLYDTVVEDRRLLRPDAWLARGLYALEWVALRLPDRVCIDTEAHAAYLRERFALDARRVVAVPVGADDVFFPQGRAREEPPERAPGPLRVLFYGTLIPLHGLEIILEASRRVPADRVEIQLIGTGQLAPVLERFLAAHPEAPVAWTPWVDFEALVHRIRQADVCLGIFGDTAKAARVIPNKVYQVLAAGRPLITRDSPGIRELVPEPGPGLHLVPPADPSALARRLTEIADHPELLADVAAVRCLSARITSTAVSRVLVDHLEGLRR